MKPIQRTTLKELLDTYAGDERTLRFLAAGPHAAMSLAEFRILVRTLHADDLTVDVYDADFGLQAFDPARKTPVGWIQPNPLR